MKTYGPVRMESFRLLCYRRKAEEGCDDTLPRRPSVEVSLMNICFALGSLRSLLLHHHPGRARAFARLVSGAVRTWLCLSVLAVVSVAAGAETPVNFKIAFIGDQGLGSNSVAVLRLIKAEGAHAVMHLGDFDYKDDPTAWERQHNDVLGPDFPLFACMGNHDRKAWKGEKGYQWYLHERLKRVGVKWNGDFGTKCSFSYKGIFFVLAAPNLSGWGHAKYIRQQLAADKSLWRICCWHENQREMQVGAKEDETGWGVYEEARKGGAIIATAHCHSYCRTHLLSNCEKQTVASRSDKLTLTKGMTFAFVSGLGGARPKRQEQTGDWFAKIYTPNQGAMPGALFATFNVDGAPDRALFYFKNMNGEVIDRFEVTSRIRH